MDSHGLTRFSPPKSPTSNRFLLRDYPNFSPPPPPDSSADADLTEDDIFAIDFSESNDLLHQHHHSHGLHHLHHHHHNKNFSDSFGILAALPKHSSNSHFYHKSSISSSSSTSRPIPSLLKPTQDRALALGKYNQHQSAPVKVPMLTNAMKKSRYFEEGEDEYLVGGEMVVPPHEMVERRYSPVVACSVVEGAGRTLKGRDLRQVRNAVWRQTGFMD